MQGPPLPAQRSGFATCDHFLAGPPSRWALIGGRSQCSSPAAHLMTQTLSQISLHQPAVIRVGTKYIYSGIVLSYHIEVLGVLRFYSTALYFGSK